MLELLTHINKIYHLDIVSHKKVAKGFLSENHCLADATGNTAFFLKKYRFDNKERIEEIHSAKKYFAAGGIPVIVPRITIEGASYFCFDNSYYALFPYVADKQLERGFLTQEAIISMAETLARLHLLGKKATLHITKRFKPWNKESSLETIAVIEVVINGRVHKTDFDEQALKAIQAKKRLILLSPITYQELNLPADHLIHGDYLDQNVFFDEQEQVSYVFDFEKTDYSPRTHKLFRSLMYSFLGGTVTEQGIAYARLYLDSYSRVYPILKDELRRGLKLFFQKSIHGFWVESEHYLKNNTRADGFLQTAEYSNYLSENYEKIEKALIE